MRAGEPGEDRCDAVESRSAVTNRTGVAAEELTEDRSKMPHIRPVHWLVMVSLASVVAAGCVDGGLFSSDNVSIDNRTARAVVITLGAGTRVVVPACGHVAFNPYDPRTGGAAIVGPSASVPPDAVAISHDLLSGGVRSIHVSLWVTRDGVREAASGPLPTCEGEPPAG